MSRTSPRRRTLPSSKQEADRNELAGANDDRLSADTVRSRRHLSSLRPPT
jgi:hypothetical protein